MGRRQQDGAATAGRAACGASERCRSSAWARALSWVAACGIAGLGAARAQPAPNPAATAAPTCTLLTTEAPAGGRLEVESTAVGQNALVKIAGTVARLLQRSGNRIAVQIPKRSQGGPVTLRVRGEELPCGTLRIIGD